MYYVNEVIEGNSVPCCAPAPSLVPEQERSTLALGWGSPTCLQAIVSRRLGAALAALCGRLRGRSM